MSIHKSNIGCVPLKLKICFATLGGTNICFGSWTIYSQRLARQEGS